VLAIAAEMVDNHQITAQYTGKNPTAMQILDMHSANLLPSWRRLEQNASKMLFCKA